MNPDHTKLARIVDELPLEMQLMASHKVRTVPQIPVTVNGAVNEASFMGFVKFLADDPGAIAGRTVDYYSQKGQQAAQGVSKFATNLGDKIVQAKDDVVESLTRKAKNYMLGFVGLSVDDFEKIPDFFNEIKDTLKNGAISLMDKALAIIGMVIRFLENFFTITLGQADHVEEQQRSLKKIQSNDAPAARKLPRTRQL